MGGYRWGSCRAEVRAIWGPIGFQVGYKLGAKRPTYVVLIAGLGPPITPVRPLRAPTYNVAVLQALFRFSSWLRGRARMAIFLRNSRVWGWFSLGYVVPLPILPHSQDPQDGQCRLCGIKLVENICGALPPGFRDCKVSATLSQN